MSKTKKELLEENLIDIMTTDFILVLVRTMIKEKRKAELYSEKYFFEFKQDFRCAKFSGISGIKFRANKQYFIDELNRKIKYVFPNARAKMSIVDHETVETVEIFMDTELCFEIIKENNKN